VAADPTLRETLSGLSTRSSSASGRSSPAGAPSDTTSAATWTLRRLACRISAATDGGLVLGGPFGPTALPASGYGKMQGCQQP
jgi:hypothetical protein